MKNVLSLLVILLVIASTACKKEKKETKQEIDLVGKWELTFGKTEYFDSTKTKIHTELFEAFHRGFP